MSGEIDGRVEMAEVLRAMTESTDAAIERGNAAVRTLECIGYTYHGGTHWKPPLGPKPRLPPDWNANEGVPRLRPLLCKDCKHFELLPETCTRTAVSAPPEPIYGRTHRRGYRRCRDERRRRWFSFRDRCGPEGRYFEAVQKEGPERPAPPPSRDD